MEAIQAYRTSDGETFFDASAAATHQSAIDNADFIAKFIADHEINERTAKTMGHYLPAFIVAVEQRVIAGGEFDVQSGPQAEAV
ncbi:hypothetical protein [Kineobactrum salinum]|uniref:Uncharacterized protein n=1 Tax=Kineobactrum salinum TaxID=2708301 RepID=A0A6C0U4T0_9GAMM|nr:hypothetical protein [Kineobactrum salinum]QIB67111.1 hypothetical protein G3T16_18635 [Kineobactrum salinum]